MPNATATFAENLEAILATPDRFPEAELNQLQKMFQRDSQDNRGIVRDLFFAMLEKFAAAFPTEAAKFANALQHDSNHITSTRSQATSAYLSYARKADLTPAQLMANVQPLLDINYNDKDLSASIREFVIELAGRVAAENPDEAVRYYIQATEKYAAVDIRNRAARGILNCTDQYCDEQPELALINGEKAFNLAEGNSILQLEAGQKFIQYASMAPIEASETIIDGLSQILAHGKLHEELHKPLTNLFMNVLKNIHYEAEEDAELLLKLIRSSYHLAEPCQRHISFAALRAIAEIDDAEKAVILNWQLAMHSHTDHNGRIKVLATQATLKRAEELSESKPLTAASFAKQVACRASFYEPEKFKQAIVIATAQEAMWRYIDSAIKNEDEGIDAIYFTLEIADRQHKHHVIPDRDVTLSQQASERIIGYFDQHIATASALIVGMCTDLISAQRHGSKIEEDAVRARLRYVEYADSNRNIKFATDFIESTTELRNTPEGTALIIDVCEFALKQIATHPESATLATGRNILKVLQYSVTDELRIKGAELLYDVSNKMEKDDPYMANAFRKNLRAYIPEDHPLAVKAKAANVAYQETEALRPNPPSLSPVEITRLMSLLKADQPA